MPRPFYKITDQLSPLHAAVSGVLAAGGTISVALVENEVVFSATPKGGDVPGAPPAPITEDPISGQPLTP